MYPATYYDGQSARAHPAQLLLEPTGISIHYTEADGRALSRHWDIAGVHQGMHLANTKISLKYGSMPYQYVEVLQAGFYETLIATYPHHIFNAPDFEFMRSRGLMGIVALTLGLALILVALYFWVLPPAAEYLASKLPIQTEMQLGDKMYEQFTADYSIDQPLTKKANEFWRALHIESDYPVNITVVDEETPNAFALPGGHIVIYSGIIHRMKDYGELVGLLGHEYTHVAGKHTTRMLYRNLSSYFFVSMLLGDASGIIVTIAANANSLKQLGFNRELEHQADVGGYDLMSQRQISPDGMLRLFEVLKKADAGITVPRFLSTHPLTDDRINYIHERLRQDKTSYIVSHFDLQNIFEEMKQLEVE
jgi:beta-barrel assembly-enhancing protease